MKADAEKPAGLVVLGHIARAHGVHGAVVVESYAENPRTILGHGERLRLLSPDGRTARPVGSLKGQEAAQGLIVKIKNVTTRDAADTLKGWRLAMPREGLPPAGEDEVYWADLTGLAVFTADGRDLGRVTALMEAGAGLLLVVADPEEPGRERLLPFQETFIVRLDLAEGRLVYDPPEGLLDL